MKTTSRNGSIIKRRHSFSPYVVHGYDRLDLYLDHADWPLPIEQLQATCAGFKIDHIAIPYQARWKQQIQILQPTRATLKILDEALKGGVSLVIFYLEIAFDIICPDKRQAKAIRNFFLASAKLRYGRHSVIRHKSSYYYSRRSSGTTKEPKNLVLYADKPSKLHNGRHFIEEIPCSHTEIRLSGSDSLEHEGIVSLKDLIDFDHLALWERTLFLYRVPTQPTKLGRILASAVGASTEVSGTALRKRANNWKTQHSISHGRCANFVLHNGLLTTPKAAQKLERITFQAWLIEALNQQ